MNNSRKCPERMRAILQAMERSIEAARRTRMNLSPANFANSQPQPSPEPATFGQSQANHLDQATTDNPPRLKARPKRLDTPLNQPFSQPAYRSQSA